jgi:hypothetical protein
MQYFWSAAILAGVILQLLVIAALWKGAWREYTLVFVYCIVLLLTTVADASAYFDPELWTRTSRLFWINDAIRQVLIFCLVISLIHRVMRDNPGRRSIRRTLIAGAGAFTALSLLLTREPIFGHWMTKLARNLSFCSVILNLALWAVLIKARHTDRRLLLISGGLGVQMAGKAIGHSLRQVSASTVLAGNLVYVLSHLACMYIWWQAFRHSTVTQESRERLQDL